jgi:hypothetical protein
VTDADLGYRREEAPPANSRDDYGVGEPWDGARGKSTTPPIAFKSAKAFCDEYTPLSYAVEPFIRSASLYTLTAKTGAGKTALLIIMALAVAAGRGEILGREVTRGRVAYVAAENPDDLRMRIKVAAFNLGIDLSDLADDLVILDKRVKPEELVATLATLAEEQPFSLVMIDTLAAFFDGTDLNDNVQGGDFMRRLRPLTRIAGLPSVVIAAHPVKNATDDNLVPYGGGAILNEVDGNLTLCKRAGSGLTALHWQGKLRGIEFEPALFRIDIGSCPDVVDTKGRQVQLPVLRPSTEVDAERSEAAAVNSDVALLRAMAASPRGGIRDWADAAKISKSDAARRLTRFKADKLVDKVLGKWSLTPLGRKALAGAE